MNKIYQTVWNQVTRTYVAVSEVAKRRHKGGVSVCAAVVALVTGWLGMLAVQPAAAAECGTGQSCVNGAVSSALLAGQTAQPNAGQAADTVELEALRNAATSATGNAAAYAASNAAGSAMTNASVFSGNPDSASSSASPALRSSANPLGAALSFGATLPQVTDYIAVSPNVVLGARTSASPDLNAMAIGPVAAATGVNALAVGGGSIAGADATTAIGAAAGVASINSTSIGAGAMVLALSNNSIAIGYNTVSMALNSASIGAHATASGAGSVAIGYNVFVAPAAVKALALGSNASASVAGSVALGSDSVAERNNVVSIGNAVLNRQIAYVAAGTSETDAANVGQVAGVAAALGGGAAINDDGSIRKPGYTIGGKTYTDVGAALAAAVTTSMQLAADAVQYDSSSHDKVTLGNAGKAVTIANLQAGSLSAASTDAVNGGQLFATNQAVAQNTADIGGLDQRVTDNTTNISHLDQRVTTNETNIASLDARTTSIAGDVTNLTNNIQTGEIGLVQQDQTTRELSVAKDTDGLRVDFRGTAGARELTGVAAGTTDTSAVNVAQLRPVLTALGGGAQMNADGSLTLPTYHVQGSTQNTVGDALGSLDDGLNTLKQDMQAGGVGIVTQDVASRAIHVGATTDGVLVDMAGTAGNRVVTGLAQGAVSATSADAVNGAQLYAQSQSVAVALGGGSTVNADGSVAAPSYSVGGTTVNNVGGAITNLDGRVTQNSSDIAGLQNVVGAMGGAVANAVQYDSSAHDRITLGGTGDGTNGTASAPKVQLTNLKDGELSATSSDAVTGAQLWSANQQISNLGQAVQNVQNAGNAFVAVNSGGNAAQAIGNGSVAIGGGATASAPNSVAIGENSVASQTNTVSVGSAGNERRITNIAAGQAPTDAVNMQQFQGGMNEVARNAYSGTASAIALTMVPEVDTSKNLAIGVGTAGYKGYQAVAVGLSARVTQNLKVKLGAGISAATTTVGAGAAYQW